MKEMKEMNEDQLTEEEMQAAEEIYRLLRVMQVKAEETLSRGRYFQIAMVCLAKDFFSHSSDDNMMQQFIDSSVQRGKEWALSLRSEEEGEDI